ncbi:hypothetical protein BWI93_15080 [Siphonobacter sp. BAB-5385]|uniref:hypothetical protein n=1 Tax=Siphonobacter sp. BAB-5385 TaxID=1864822 RepID=UPI000B9DFA3D|nr:hypothetical protein [Siphonobacter sp. BAB-5385]OZI07349.1 hypothetical protein BWI93_15080 [Siphonobacter sp. BAB-5385]
MKIVLTHFFFLFGILSVFAQTARATSQSICYIKLANTSGEAHKSSESTGSLKRAVSACVNYIYRQALANKLLDLHYEDSQDSDHALLLFNKSLNPYAKLNCVANAWAINDVSQDILGKKTYADTQPAASALPLAILENNAYEESIDFEFGIRDKS